jgi:hypothetical protein
LLYPSPESSAEALARSAAPRAVIRNLKDVVFQNAFALAGLDQLA